MAGATSRFLSFYCSSLSKPFLSVYVLLVNFPLRLEAQSSLTQSSTPPIDPTLTAAAPTPTITPSSVNNFAAISSAVSTWYLIPDYTDSADYAPHNNNTSGGSHVLNYYFLLLALLVLFLAATFWSLARRRHKRLQSSRSNERSALAQDLQTWPAARRGAGRWRFTAGETRGEEGLDERGEAPPPYLKEPELAHQKRGDEDLELHDVHRFQGKPPDYEDGPARR